MGWESAVMLDVLGQELGLFHSGGQIILIIMLPHYYCRKSEREGVSRSVVSDSLRPHVL